MADTTSDTALDSSLTEHSVCTYALGECMTDGKYQSILIPNAQVDTFAGKSSLIHQAVYVCRTCGGEDEHKGCCAGIYRYPGAKLSTIAAGKEYQFQK